jgi:coenzyme F420-reducing hydrogenase beta subunit
MELNAEGFYRPVIDSSKCVECGACARACPWLNEVVNSNGSVKAPRTIAAFTKDETVRMISSSGGLFTELAKAVLKEGGCVVGVAQLNVRTFGHVVIESFTDLSKLQGPKYVQANPGQVYREVWSLLKKGRKVLFSGTPCQVAALYAVLGKAACENLWTVDVVCHGTPSVKVWRKYVDEIECAANSKLVKIDFRNKQSGWKHYSLHYEFNGGEEKYVYYADDIFMKLFLLRICQNESCTNCHYRKLPRIADITLGDFWGVANYHPEMDDNKGTSVILLNTVHGEFLFNSISNGLVLCESTLEKAVVGNPCIVRSGRPHRNRARFFENLDKYTLEELIQKCDGNQPLHWRFYRMVRRCLGHVKLQITNRLRK